MFHHSESFLYRFAQLNDSLIFISYDRKVVSDFSFIHLDHVNPFVFKTIDILSVSVQLAIHLYKMLLLQVFHRIADEFHCLLLFSSLSLQIQLISNQLRYGRIDACHALIHILIQFFLFICLFSHHQDSFAKHVDFVDVESIGFNISFINGFFVLPELFLDKLHFLIEDSLFFIKTSLQFFVELFMFIFQIDDWFSISIERQWIAFDNDILVRSCFSLWSDNSWIFLDKAHLLASKGDTLECNIAFVIPNLEYFLVFNFVVAFHSSFHLLFHWFRLVKDSFWPTYSDPFLICRDSSYLSRRCLRLSLI